MKKYDVVIKQDLKELIEMVNEAVAVGYYPKGGLLYIDGAYIQAIFLRDKENVIPEPNPLSAEGEGS